MESIIAYLSSNPYFGAGAGLLGMGTGLAMSRKFLQYSSYWAKRYCLVSVEIPSKDRSYNWVLDWLSEKSTYRPQHVSVETSFKQIDSGELATNISLVPSVGTHYFRHGSHWIKAERTRERNVVDMTSGSLWETLTLTTPGRSRQVFRDIMEEAKTHAMSKESQATVIYSSSGGDWHRFGFPRKRRPFESVILDRGQSQRILDDAKQFLNSSKWYMDSGIPYRRGYLFYGPPGCGKSSFISALAGALKLNICTLNLHSRGINDDSLNLLLNTAPQRSIILLEDIDAALGEGRELKSGTKVTFSGLLNALDGVAATEGGGRLVCMTTNHLEKLDPALIRPGRVDLKEEFGLATRSQMEEMFLKFFPGEPELAQAFVDNVDKDTRLSMAQLQSFLMSERYSPHTAAAQAQRLNLKNL